MANNSFIETITTGTFDVSKARYDQLLDIETKYNQLFTSMFNLPCDLYTLEGDEFNEVDKILEIIDQKKYGKEIQKTQNEEVANNGTTTSKQTQRA